MNTIPNDVVKFIITLLSPHEYYVIYRVSKNFRRCLKFVYDHNALLRNNPDDILSGIVYGYEYNAEKIFKAVTNIHEFPIKDYLKLLVHYNLVYTEIMLWRMTYCCDLVLLQHLEKLNNLRYRYMEIIGVQIGNKMTHTDLFNYVFDKLLNCGTNTEISSLAAALLGKNRVDLVEKLIDTNYLTIDVLSILVPLIDQDNLNLVNKLLAYNSFKTKRYQTLYNHTCSHEMEQLINSYARTNGKWLHLKND